MGRHLEDDLQQACVQWFELQYPKLAPALHHSPNGGRRNPREAARLKKQGVRKGFPDLALYHGVWMGGYNCPGLAVELKIKPNKPTAGQLWWLRHLAHLDWETAVCYSLEEFQAEVRNYLDG